jgi:hyperosmotically inducible protein
VSNGECKEEEMTSTMKVAITAVLAGALALPGLAQTKVAAGQQTASTTQQAVRRSRYDQQIQQEVTSELKKHDWTKNVSSSVEDGIVTLKGTVPTYLDKVRAFDKVHNKDHVKGVRNLIVVAGKYVPDQQLLKNVADQLRYDRVGQGIVFNNFNLAVNDGVVTVGGEARTPVDASSALAIVETTPGVKGVIDKIHILPTSLMDDQDRIRLARAIYGDPSLQRYALDPEAPIRIIVDNGNVTLYGVVANKMDKEIADMRAKQVPGIFSVTDKLVVAHNG